ncbi:Chemotaxis signal transduction protein [Halanaeroarchaeum sp. HSR-CO]|uniref:chemotaxis protein CheW n=1 Tax=Halanaeroarchaeum sp. HSR-CO TaxID=2866382 RepID=UPI00217D64F5|nr:chemotaxis protein CheW [Halanaeroarchaeum sp. HSR-CO]UWG47644.1 Chemotaxis signal transduction protein [Halanaeroarchaeum sp. HSR-CO]
MAVATESGYEVLEFDLEGKRYCVTLDTVDEIVTNDGAITEIPNTSPEVVGVMDLRGETTTIVDPRVSLGRKTGSRPKYVVVFESEDRPVGWLIQDVYQVTTVDGDHLDETVGEGAVNGVFKRDDEFSIWVDPDAINA